MKRLISNILLTVFILFGFMNLNVYATTNISKDNVCTLIQVNDLSSDYTIAEQQIKKNVNKENIKLKIDNIGLESNILKLDGVVQVNNKKILFDLSGELKKIDTSKDIVVANLIDKYNNFDVIHFSINNSSSNFISASGNKYDIATLNLYLKEKISNNYIFLETFLPKQINEKKIFDINYVNSFSSKD
ncbi:hypothetical protein CLTEP_27990 [Clostridium tepidiprofundi DSM 19306]|uniref:Uncharacterized protein n=1 Tax=Clostridium tepidiprofundi DSM 19306 TaxID=1121338 RepID=A0A151AF08_9CLOT|nr:hypothetical protein [Clostridium tepidiprofundi]KYH25967.1 hypothetical protein CLTEP_27990 [Clostridium tepidiprofundi DSM 19306]